MDAPDSPRQAAVDLMLVLARAMDAATTRALESADGRSLTLVQLRALRALLDGPLPVLGLAEALGAHHSSTSRLVSRLQRAALVSRTPGEQDRREVLVALTPTGRSTCEAAMGRRRSALEELLAPLDEGQRSSVEAGLRELAQALRAAGALPADAWVGDVRPV